MSKHSDLTDDNYDSTGKHGDAATISGYETIHKSDQIRQTEFSNNNQATTTGFTVTNHISYIIIPVYDNSPSSLGMSFDRCKHQNAWGNNC